MSLCMIRKLHSQSSYPRPAMEPTRVSTSTQVHIELVYSDEQDAVSVDTWGTPL